MFVLALFLAPTFIALLAAHKFATGMVCWAVFNAVVDSMPEPDDDSALLYRWLYAFLNMLAANLRRMLIVLCPRFTTLFPKDGKDLTP